MLSRCSGTKCLVKLMSYANKDHRFKIRVVFCLTGCTVLPRPSPATAPHTDLCV